MAERAKRLNTWRLFLIIGSIMLWAGAVCFRLVQLQILRHAELAALAAKAQMQTKTVVAPRGIIYDAHLDQLASNATVGTLVAEPWRVRDKAHAASRIAATLGMNADELFAKLSDPSHQTYQIIKRRLDPAAEAAAGELDLDGIYLIDESMRVYPNLDLACHVLGFVNLTDSGAEGIERQYERVLQGTPGVLTSDVDAHGRAFRGKYVKAPVQGHSLVLSIDRSIQYIAAKELAEGVEKANAAAGTVIVMETDTGRIIALANYPQFNCNTYNEYEAGYWRNRAVTDSLEPGSTFKVVVAASALEVGLTRPNEMIDCQMGSITIGRHVFHDHKPYGLLTFAQILEHSSNVGAAKLGLRLGEQRLYEGLRNFGFGTKTGVDLPGEVIGLVREPQFWSALSIGAISFGQEVGVTSIQILNAINAIACGGYRLRPSIVDRIIDQKGNLISARSTERVRILRPETAATVREAFEGVVLRGTGRQAALEGYRAAGKTGTAQKIINKHYSSSKYLASFIGFAPLPNPRLTILVQIDEPKGAIYGGEVSAPVFRKIAQQSLMQLHVPPDKSLPLPTFNPALAADSLEDFMPNATPVLPLVNAAPSDSEMPQSGGDAIVMRVGGETVVMPDFRGLPKRKVLEQCLELGIRLEGAGSGVAVQQVPLAGTRVPTGEVCYVTFARSAAAAHSRIPGIGATGAMARNHGARAMAARP